MDIGEQRDGSFIRSGTVKLVAVEIPEIDMIEVEEIVPIAAMVTPSDVNGVCDDARYYWWASSNIRFLVNGQGLRWHDSAFKAATRRPARGQKSDGRNQKKFSSDS